ncbi:hypothetical protein B0A52_08520 [Exophiala mesophila]|uniref:Alcohol dehydrogenase-like N-terminal domain-containing protein n=1 Tax=Exophiala mesophila TaxID=212818 RepID=A0A438MY81_EXOME|nr:hypothetical protein B0A52_08520 [Exophiala mesophila]
MSLRTQKALVVSELGKPVTLHSDWPIHQPGPGQVQVRVIVGSINPHDQKARDWGLFVKDNLPGGLGNDLVGEVTLLGEGVNAYTIGERIFAQGCFKSSGWSQNALQEYAIVEVDHSASVPEMCSSDEAATLPCNLLAALFAIHDGLGIPAPWTPEAATFDYRNSSILIIGGGSNTGRLGVQLAALAGIGRIIVVGGDPNQLTEYGATDIIDRHGSPDQITAKIRDHVGDDLVHVFDAVNPPPTQHIGINALSRSKKGKMARLLPSGPPDLSQIKLNQDEYELKDIYGVSLLKPDLAKPFWKRLPAYLVEKRIRPTAYQVVEGLDAEKLNQLLDDYRDKKKTVKANFHPER